MNTFINLHIINSHKSQSLILDASYCSSLHQSTLVLACAVVQLSSQGYTSSITSFEKSVTVLTGSKSLQNQLRA